MERAQRNIASQFAQFVTGIFAVATNILQIISLIGILALIEPLITPVLLSLIVPYTYFLWKLAAADIPTNTRAPRSDVGLGISWASLPADAR